MTATDAEVRGLVEALRGGSAKVFDYLARRDADDLRLAQSQLLRRLVRLRSMEQVAVLAGLWRMGYDLYEPLFEPVSPEMNSAGLEEWVRARLAVCIALAEEGKVEPLRDRPDLSPCYRRFSECLAQVEQAGRPGLLPEPFQSDAPVVSPHELKTIAQWAYFNPNGPTLCDLTLERASEDGDWLLVFSSAHPFSPATYIYGRVVDDRVRNAHGLLEVLWRVFCTPEYAPISSLPTHIAISGESPLTPSQFRDVLTPAAKQIGSDLGTECETIREHWCEPWARSQVQMQQALGAMLAAKRRVESAGTSQHAFNQEEFSRWFKMVTDPQHVAAELAEISMGWVGSVFQVSGRFG